MSSIFDQITATKDSSTEAVEETQISEVKTSSSDDSPGRYTASAIKAATQELLKYGLLEADKKPNLYQSALTQQETINQILDPLDLYLKIDDMRGLAFLVVAERLFAGEEDEWSHPLIRRQRLNLEQSLLIAILRQHYIVHEQEAGIGASEAIVALDELLPQLQLYLGDPGSDAREQKRLRNLLEYLKGHGIVSEIDDKDQVTIRPMITHLANPETLQGLLHYFREQTCRHSKPELEEDTP